MPSEATNAEVFWYLAEIVTRGIPHNRALVATAASEVSAALDDYDKSCQCVHWPCYHIALYLIGEMVAQGEKEETRYDA